LVVVPERAEGAREGGVGGDVHDLRAVAEGAELRGVEPGGAREGGLPAEDAVELDGVADRLVDLERHLLAAEDERGGARRALRRPQEGLRLLGDAGGVAEQVELADELPASGAVLAPHARVAAALRL